MSPLNQKLYAFALARYFDWLQLVTGRQVAVFFRDGGIGDIFCTFPAAAALVERNPEAYHVYCTNPAFKALPALLGCFDRVIGIRCSDLVVSNTSLRHLVCQFRYPDELPGGVSSQYLPDEFAASFGLPAGLPWPKIRLGVESAKVKRLFANSADSRPVVCIHTGPTWAVREWSLARWDELAAKLKAQFGCRVLQIGASRHFREGERRERPVVGAEDCRDIFDLQETVQIVARSRLLVGIDSGMIHVAVSLGLPVVGVFGPTSPALRLPPTKAVGVTADVPCLGCHHRHPRLHWQSGCAHEFRCMKELLVDSVFAEVLRLW